ncbi:MAG TPA: LL-diaminopimelate aminotransferase [Rhabdochlamydiaceae bacterium]|jgi:LL-diaminopimelate aminotransferase
MAKLNPSFLQLKSEYIFAIIDAKLIELKKNLPAASWINLSIGDIALPLAPRIVKAIADAAEEMSTSQGLKGYAPTYGYGFLRQAIAENEYKEFSLSPEEIFVSDGTNSDAVNILELFHPSCVIGIPNPSYPAYLNSSIIAGRKKICLLPCLEKNLFAPQPPKKHCDIIYVCTPSNPTGLALTRKDLQAWVDYALKQRAILCIDAAYNAFITSVDVPKSIYEIPGAKECAVEFKSFSKSAGFTGLRCAYVVIPKTVRVLLDNSDYPLHNAWAKRQDIKFNGVAYPIQRGAQAALSPEGLAETREQVRFYLSMAGQIKDGLKDLGHTCWGGEDCPYIWWKVPEGFTSWEFFDHLLSSCQLIAMPGVGFGPLGEGYVRLSAFSRQDKVSLALERIRKGI